MTRIRSFFLLLIVAIGVAIPAGAMDVPVVGCGWYCYVSSGGDMAECIGEGSFRRRGYMADCDTRRECMPDSYSGEACTSFCVGPSCYDV